MFAQVDIIRKWEKDEGFKNLPFELKARILKRFFDTNLTDPAFHQLPPDLQDKARNRFVAAHLYPEEKISAGGLEKPSLGRRLLQAIGVPTTGEKPISKAAGAQSLIELQAKKERVPLHEYRVSPQVIEQAAQGFVKGATAGVIPGIIEATTGERPWEATTIPGKIAGGAGEAGGFWFGPAKLGGGLAGIALSRLAPAAAEALLLTGTEGLAARLFKPAVKEALGLAGARGIADTGRALQEQTWGEAAKDIASGIKSGGVTGAIFGATRGLFPADVEQRGRRIITGLLGLNAQRTLEGHGLPTDRPLSDVAFDTAMDVFFLWAGEGRRGLEKAEKDIKAGRKPEIPKPTEEQQAKIRQDLAEKVKNLSLPELIVFRDHPRMKPFADLFDAELQKRETIQPYSPELAKQLRAETRALPSGQGFELKPKTILRKAPKKPAFGLGWEAPKPPREPEVVYKIKKKGQAPIFFKRGEAEPWSRPISKDVLFRKFEVPKRGLGKPRVTPADMEQAKIKQTGMLKRTDHVKEKAITQYREKLEKLKKGVVIQKGGKNYKVIDVSYQDKEAPQLRTDVVLLEVGKKRYTEKAGVGLAAGKTIKIDNAIYSTFRATKPGTSWEVIEKPKEFPASETNLTDFNEAIKSKGHIGFTDKYEYFSTENEDLYRAPKENALDATTGVRLGARFESTKAGSQAVLKQVGLEEKRLGKPLGVNESEVAYGSEEKASREISDIARDAEQKYRDTKLKISDEPVPDNVEHYDSPIARHYAKKKWIDYRGQRLREGPSLSFGKTRDFARYCS